MKVLDRGFITLRSTPNAQAEIRVYSDAMLELLQEAYPRTIGLYLASLEVEL